MFTRLSIFSGVYLWGEMMSALAWFQCLLEYLAGETDLPPAGCPLKLSNYLFWGIWWSILIGIVFVFSGQSSKFIYIDF
jgi:hypothetical protein